MNVVVSFVARGDALELTVPGPGGERTVRVSNPDKVCFPERGITKRQVVEYYLAVSEPLMRVLAQRPVTLKRFVGGVTGDAFYSKRLPPGAPPWVDSVEITFPSGRTARQVCPTEPAVLAWDDLTDVHPDDFDVLTVPALLARRGDPHAELDGDACGLETLVDWAVRDERDRGLGDLPYPPGYPKMPGEPLRVQPSRAKRATSENRSNWAFSA